MSRIWIRIVLAAAAMFFVWAALPGTTFAQCRIEPFGDSITYGYGSYYVPGGYRGWLVASPPAIGPIQMVGAQNDPYSAPQLDPLNQQYHSAVRGAQADWLLGAVETNYAVLPGYAAPGIVLVHAGTNDLLNNIDVPTAAGHLAALVKGLAQKYPSAKILVASLVPFASLVTVKPYPQDGVALNGARGWFNAYIPGLLDTMNNGRPAGTNPRFFFVDQSTYFPAGGLTADGVHPNDLGYSQMANVWRASIQWVVANYGC